MIYPSLKEDVSAANAVLHLSSLTNGELTHRAYKYMESKTGLALADIADGSRDVRMTFKDLQGTTAEIQYIACMVWFDE